MNEMDDYEVIRKKRLKNNGIYLKYFIQIGIAIIVISFFSFLIATSFKKRLKENKLSVYMDNDFVNVNLTKKIKRFHSNKLFKNTTSKLLAEKPNQLIKKISKITDIEDTTIKHRSRRIIPYLLIAGVVLLIAGVSSLVTAWHFTKVKLPHVDKYKLLFYNYDYLHIFFNAMKHRHYFCKYGQRNWPCSGYYKKSYEFMPHPSLARRCSFSRNSEFSLPTFFTKDNPLANAETYKCMLRNGLNNLHCLVKPHDGYCGMQKCRNDEDPTNWGCKNNERLYDIYKSFIHCDYKIKGRPQGTFLKILDYQCNTYTYPYKKHPYLKNVGALSVLYLIATYYRCITAKYQPNCPNLCKNPYACQGDFMISRCYLVKKINNRNQKKILNEYSWIKPLFEKISACHCIEGFRYNYENEVCDIILAPCSQGTECLNGGECTPLSSDLMKILGRLFSCSCPPAWKGLQCNEIRDPCLIPENRKQCMKVPHAYCMRDASNFDFGYKCECPSGYVESTSFSLPDCKDIDECAITAPCYNGGECQNLIGSYKCKCIMGYSGEFCEIPPTLPHWMPWNSWSHCSVTCGNGMRQRMRICSEKNACMGSVKQTKTCVGIYLDCTTHKLQSQREDFDSKEFTEFFKEFPDDALYDFQFQLMIQQQKDLNRSRKIPNNFIESIEFLSSSKTYQIFGLFIIIASSSFFILYFSIQKQEYFRLS